MTSLDDDAMKNRPWTAVMIVAVLSRLVAINGAAALHLQSHPSKLLQHTTRTAASSVYILVF